MTKQAEALQTEIVRLGNHKSALEKDLYTIQDQCAHENLPARVVGEEYMDTCPDCGHISYAYIL